MINDTTPNFALPLPHPQNNMAEDCPRIRKSLGMLDALLKDEQNANAASALETAKLFKNIDEVAKSARSDASAALKAAQNAKGGGLYADVPIDQVPADVLAGMAVGQFITVPEPVASGGSAGDADLSVYPTREEMKAYAPQKRTTALDVHVDPSHANASDTLDEGRGLSADKPFATLPVAVMWSYSNYYACSNIRIILHNDIVIDNSWNIMLPSAMLVRIVSDTTTRSITLPGTDTAAKRIGLYSGHLQFENVNVTAASITAYGSAHAATVELKDVNVTGVSSAWNPLAADGQNATVFITDNVTISGANVLNFINARNGGLVRINGTTKINGKCTSTVCADTAGTVIAVGSYAISGNVEGSRYTAIRGSKIILFGKADQLPGTIAGTCDESSIVA